MKLYLISLYQRFEDYCYELTGVNVSIVGIYLMLGIWCVTTWCLLAMAANLLLKT